VYRCFFYRHVVNGEILGVSLLLEDVLQTGLPEMFFSRHEEDATSVGSPSQRSRPNTSTSRRSASRRHSVIAEDGNAESGGQGDSAGHFDIPKGSLSVSKNPKAAVKLINMFLLVCSRLEMLKTDWACRKMSTNEIATTKHFRTFW
jgi:hypothetical protein